MKLNKYNHLATRIQKVWRGFYVRKYIFNYYSFKRYLGSLLIKNEAIRYQNITMLTKIVIRCQMRSLLIL